MSKYLSFEMKHFSVFFCPPTTVSSCGSSSSPTNHVYLSALNLCTFRTDKFAFFSSFAVSVLMSMKCVVHVSDFFIQFLFLYAKRKFLIFSERLLCQSSRAALPKATVHECKHLWVFRFDYRFKFEAVTVNSHR